MVLTIAVPGVDGLSLTAGSSTTDYTAAASNDDTTTFGTLVYSAGAFLLVTKWLKTIRYCRC